MQASTVAPVPIVRGRRDAHDIEIVLRFDPASPISRTEVQIEGSDSLGTDEYLEVVTDAVTRLFTYASDYKAAMAADRGDETSERRHCDRRTLRRRHGLRLPYRGVWCLQTRQGGALALLDPTGQPVVIASHAADRQRLRRVFGRIVARAGAPH